MRVERGRIAHVVLPDELSAPGRQVTFRLHPAPLREGDEVRIVVEGIGELVSVAGAPVPAPAIPPARVSSRARRRS